MNRSFFSLAAFSQLMLPKQAIFRKIIPYIMV
jgi:hypothetical protein